MRDLVVCASKTARDYQPIPGLCYGKAIALVDVTECMRTVDGAIWWLENPKLIRPFDVHASANFFYVQDEIEVVENDRDLRENNPSAREGGRPR